MRDQPGLQEQVPGQAPELQRNLVSTRKKEVDIRLKFQASMNSFNTRELSQNNLITKEIIFIFPWQLTKHKGHQERAFSNKIFSEIFCFEKI